MPIARNQNSQVRVIAHVDMDCFYVQVEQRRNPQLKGVPTAVVQYNSWKGGGLIAVGYEARKFGVKRSMRGDEAKKVCPDIQLVQVPVAHGKANLNLYRDAGSEVVVVLSKKGTCERASIDEVYLDLTDAAVAMLSECPPDSLGELDEETRKTHIIGFDLANDGVEEVARGWLSRKDADQHDKLLACGAVIVAGLRKEVLLATGFTCSAGVAHNKMLAKLASAMNKPAQQTVVPQSSITELLASLPVKKMKHLGGKLGASVESDLGVKFVGDLLQYSKEFLEARYGTNTGFWLWNAARGICGEEVKGRLLPMSHGSGKTFPGPKALRTLDSVQTWLNELCEELSERIESDLLKNQRVAHTLTLHARAYQSYAVHEKKFPSKSCPLRYGTAKIQEDALKLFNSALHEYLGSKPANAQGNQDAYSWGVTSLSISAGNIVAVPTGVTPITRFFHGRDTGCSSSTQLSDGNESTSGENQTLPIASASHEISRTHNTTSIAEEAGRGSSSWDYSVDSIDHAVLEELPLEIQDEIRRTLRLPKPKAKRTSSIANYFLPVKKK